jgi:hypothetical protein
MPECTDLRRTVPLYKVVAAAVVDSHEDIVKVQQTYSHWAARGLKKITRETLKSGKRTVILTVNRNTNTATLPADFGEELFVGVVVNGVKIPLRMRSDLIDEKNVAEVPCEDKCEKCNQNKKICEDLAITEETVLITINDNTYEQTVIKKLYPNGDYYIETKIPVYDLQSSTVIYTTTKQFITAVDLSPCGCIEDTEENKEKIKCCAYDVWCNYYAPCDCNCATDYGGYRVFEETGLIQFDKASSFTKVYLEYYGFMQKKNGQYHVPEVAFETLVEWVKYKSIQNRRNIPDITIQRWFENYRRERGNMLKVMGRASLSAIIKAALSLPKFDFDYDCWAGSTIPCTSVSPASTAVTSSSVCETTTAPVCPPSSTKNLSPFQIAVIAGMGQGTPTPGGNTYQLDALKGAIGLNMIIVNNAPETILANQFTFDSATGTISRWQGDGVTPNNWAAGDVLIANFSKFI